MNKNLGMKIVSSMLLGTMCLYTVPVFAYTKDETVYSKMNSNGNNYSTIVSEKISNDDNSELIKDISNNITGLIDKGVDINVYATSYDYSKLPDLKISLLEKASKDAKARAISMLKPTHNSVGKIQSVRMGVYQITPVDSTSVSDMGINDTSSIDKKVTAVANVSFKIK